MNEEYTGKYIAYGEGDDEVWVCPVCPECHKFIKQGEVFDMLNGFNELQGFSFKSWICKTHGEIEPEWHWGLDVSET